MGIKNDKKIYTYSMLEKRKKNPTLGNFFFSYKSNIHLVILANIYMHENRHCKKIGFYLHSYGSNRDVQILSLPLLKTIFFIYRLINEK